MIPKDPEDININASPQGLLEIAEHFFRRKMQLQEQETAGGPEKEEGGAED